MAKTQPLLDHPVMGPPPIPIKRKKARTQPLLDYLMEGPPAIPTSGTRPRRNTRNPRYYSFKNISSFDIWSDFTYARIMEEYGDTLLQAQIDIDPTMSTSTPQAINSECGLTACFADRIDPRVDCALRAGFQYLAPQLDTLNLTALIIDVGDSAKTVKACKPDLAFFDPSGSLSTKPNRCPGDLKVSWKWSSRWATSTRSRQRVEYRQVLSQVNFYMKQHKARYGFVITDTELVPIKRLDRRGNLLVAQAIPWSAAGPERLTTPLALWYLGMLAASNTDWELK